MRNVIKWMGNILAVFIVLMLLVEGGIYYVSRTEWFKTRVTSALQGALGRDITLANMGASLRGIFVDDLHVAEQGGFEKGTFAQLGRLRVRLSLWHLLHGHVKVNTVILSNAKVHLTVDENGASSWADLMPVPANEEEAEQKSASAPGLHITADRVRLEQLYIRYIDKAMGHTAEIDGFTVEVRHFSLRDPFTLHIYGHVVDQTASALVKIPLTILAKVDLHELDFSQAYVELKKATASYQGASAVLTGRVDNWLSPQATLDLHVRHLSPQTFAAWAALPAMELDTLKLSSKLALDLEKQALTVHHIKLEAPGLEAEGKGGLVYGEAKLVYDFSAQAKAVLGEIGRWLQVLADPYQLVGTVQAELTATQEKFAAQLTADEVGGLAPQAGRFSNMTGKISGWEAMNFKTGQWTSDIKGKFQGSPLSLELNATQTAQKIEAILKAYAKEMVWQAPAAANVPEEESPSQQAPAQPTAWPYPPIDLKMDVQVDQLQVPYFYGTQVALSSDLQALTPDLKQAHGTIRLSTQDGQIQDLYKLTNANPLTKVLFMSLNVTGKVFNSLNVLGVLKSIGGGISNVVSGGKEKETAAVKTQTILGPDGEPLEVEVEAVAEVGGGEMAYDKFSTQVDFTSGKATVKEGTFVSPMMSFRLDGTTDFNSGVVDLTVHAAPGRHEVDGMMPLTLKIGGMVDDPQGSMQLLGSVTSLVTQTVTNNVVSRNLTKGVKGLFGLFKKKEDTETNVPAEPAEAVE